MTQIWTYKRTLNSRQRTVLLNYIHDLTQKNDWTRMAEDKEGTMLYKSGIKVWINGLSRFESPVPIQASYEMEIQVQMLDNHSLDPLQERTLLQSVNNALDCETPGEFLFELNNAIFNVWTPAEQRAEDDDDVEQEPPIDPEVRNKALEGALKRRKARNPRLEI